MDSARNLSRSGNEAKQHTACADPAGRSQLTLLFRISHTSYLLAQWPTSRNFFKSCWSDDQCCIKP